MRGSTILTAMALALACNGSSRGDSMLSGAGAATEDGDGDGNGPGGGDGDGDGDGASADGAEGEAKLDVQGGETEGAGDGGGPCGCGTQIGFSYIWVANTGGGSVSKINTQTMQEEGRYLTRSGGSGNPSRTSVSLSGRRAAVANRNGGVIALNSLAEDCDPGHNGQPGLQTSQGAADVLAWGQDDCVAWYADFSCSSQRPIAWVAGDLDEAACTYSGERLWTACRHGFSGVPTAYLLEGTDGNTVLSTDVAGFGGNTYGGYGGAVDSEGNFWMTDWDRSQIAVVYIDGSGTEVFTHSEVGGYGITVDVEDRVWVTGSYAGGVARFDPVSATWAVAGANLSSATGIQQAADDRIWTGGSMGDPVSGPDVLVWIDPETMAVGDQLVLDGFPKGISVDVDGYVWVVTFDRVHKVDPDTMQIVDSYDGLDGPYTYSDMTGWALHNTQCPTPEG